MGRKRDAVAIIPEKMNNSVRRAVVGVCADIESARMAYIAYSGRNPRIYQRNIHAEDCDVYVHVVVADIVK